MIMTQQLEEIVFEIVAERKRAVEKHGELHLPSVCEVLLNRQGGSTPERMCEEYELPSESRAKFKTELARDRNELTWAHVATEELSEAVSAKSDKERREELLQLAGVILVWIQDIDRNQTPSIS
jgi:TPP-dependent pyruvate/acetoin dehydrogenase alpha subunit